MKRLLIASLAGLLVSCGGDVTLNHEDLSTAKALQAQALESDLAWELVESLTTEVGPRMAGTEADARAVEWATTKLLDLGFDRVWTEPVTFPLWERNHESARVVSPFPQPLVITALGGSPGTPDGGVQAEVVVFEDFQSLRDAAPGSLEGKIAFINHRMDRFQDGHGYGEAGPGRWYGPYAAAQKGAAGLLIRSVGTDNDRLPHTGNISGNPPEDVGTERVPSAALSNPDADLLAAMLERGEPVVVDLQLDTGYAGEATSYNVIGEINGSGEEHEFVVLAAHLDSWDNGTGAVDDGAGVAIVTAATKLIADLPERPGRGIRVILFANEEQGLYGAKAYAEAHQDNLDAHLIGAESDFGAGRIYRFRTRVDSEAMPVMEQLAELLEPLGIVWDKDTLAGGASDLSELRKRGVAMVDLNQDGSDYFDYHHSANDTLDKVDPQALQQNLAAYVSFAYLAASSEARFGPVATE